MIHAKIKVISVVVVVAHLVAVGLLMLSGVSRKPNGEPGAMQVSVVQSAAPVAAPKTVQPSVSSSTRSQPKTLESGVPRVVEAPKAVAAADATTPDRGGSEAQRSVTAALAAVKSAGSGSSERSSPQVDAAFKGNRVPDYPALSRRLGEQGSVLLRVMISPEGRAGEVQVLQSSGYARLDQSAAEAIRQWRFVPAMQDGKPVAAWYEWRWTFKLN